MNKSVPQNGPTGDSISKVSSGCTRREFVTTVGGFFANIALLNSLFEILKSFGIKLPTLSDLVKLLEMEKPNLDMGIGCNCTQSKGLDRMNNSPDEVAKAVHAILSPILRGEHIEYSVIRTKVNELIADYGFPKVFTAFQREFGIFSDDTTYLHIQQSIDDVADNFDNFFDKTMKEDAILKDQYNNHGNHLKNLAVGEVILRFFKKYSLYNKEDGFGSSFIGLWKKTSDGKIQLDCYMYSMLAYYLASKKHVDVKMIYYRYNKKGSHGHVNISIDDIVFELTTQYRMSDVDNSSQESEFDGFKICYEGYTALAQAIEVIPKYLCKASIEHLADLAYFTYILDPMNEGNIDELVEETQNLSDEFIINIPDDGLEISKCYSLLDKFYTYVSQCYQKDQDMSVAIYIVLYLYYDHVINILTTYYNIANKKRYKDIREFGVLNSDILHIIDFLGQLLELTESRFKNKTKLLSSNEVLLSLPRDRFKSNKQLLKKIMNTWRQEGVD